MTALKRELEGTLVREKSEPAIKTADGKVRLVYNLLDGLAGKRVRITVEEVKEEEKKKEEGKVTAEGEKKAEEKKGIVFESNSRPSK